MTSGCLLSGRTAARKTYKRRGNRSAREEDAVTGRAPGSPNIPDPALGFEIDTGFQWMLPDNWSLDCVLCWWRPGGWFGYACIDRSVPGWNVPGPANNFGVRPGKSIDPVIGGHCKMVFSF